MSDNDPDPLADWRPGSEKMPPAVTAGEKEAYTAFDNPADRNQPRLHICPLEHEAWEWLPYIDLHRVVHDGPHGTRVGLIWSYAIVIIKGRNLQKLDHHLAHEVVREIRAFDPTRFDPPSDPAAPYINAIEISSESRKTMMDAEMLLLSDIERRH